jgi:hypothetical protein
MIKAIALEPLKEGDRGNAPKASYRAKLSQRGCSPNHSAPESRENPVLKGGKKVSNIKNKYQKLDLRLNAPQTNQ